MDIPDDLFRQVKARAAMEGISLKELLSRCVQASLYPQTAPPAAGSTRSRLPVIKRRGKSVIPNLSPERQARLDEEADLAKLG